MNARSLGTREILLACACALLSVCAACGDDSGVDAAVAGSGGAGGVAAGSGVSGAPAGTGGGGGMGGAKPVVCGGQMCTVNATLKMINAAASACCASGMKCGQRNTSGKCLEGNAKGTPDKSCPAVPVMVLGMSLMQPGCCTPAGLCGADYGMVGWGCVARSDIGPDMGTGAPFLALKCGSGSGDAGVDDAGL